jgi:fatty-acyl-CoA synthase
MWWDLLDRFDPAEHDISCLEVLMTGGAPVPPELARRAEETFGAHIVIAYGQTEAHGHITQTHIVGARDTGVTSPSAVGRALPHTSIEILREDGSHAAPGEPGELVCTSPTLMVGYRNRDEETARALDEQGRLHTGDLCCVDADGVVSFVGRLSELIVRGGEKVAPAEVEAALLEHPAVGRVAVAGVPDSRLGQRVAAFILASTGATLRSDQLADFLDDRLARFKIPEVWQVVDDFPLAPTGKVAKNDLVAAWVRSSVADPA